MKTFRFFGILLTAVLAITLTACDSTENDDPDSPVVPVDEKDFTDVPASGGTIEKGDIAVSFPSGTFTEDTRVAVVELKKGKSIGDTEVSPFYQLTMPMKTNKPFTVEIKSEKVSGDIGFTVLSPGYAISFSSDVTNRGAQKATYSNGTYTTTVPVFNISDSKENVSIIIGLSLLSDGSAAGARNATRANNAVVGKDGNMSWELSIDYGSMQKYSTNYKKLEAQLPTLNMYIKDCIKSLHGLGFKVPDDTKLNYYICSASLFDKAIGREWDGVFCRSAVSRSFDAIYLKDETMLGGKAEKIKQTIIHETLHNYQSYYIPYGVDPFPRGEYLAMYEIGAVWVEKLKAQDGLPNGLFQKQAGLMNCIKNNFRVGLSSSSSDVKALYGAYDEEGYALAPMLYHMISKNYSRGYKDKSIVSLYDTHWNKMYTQTYSMLDVLDDWYVANFKSKYFDGTDNVNDFYLQLWKGDIMSNFGFCDVSSVLEDNKIEIKKMNEKNSKFSLDGKVYPYGCEGLYFEMDKTCFKDSVLKETEMVIKQEADGLKTYLLYSSEGGRNTYVHPQVATKKDSIVLSGTELETLRKKYGYFNCSFFLLTVREKGSLKDTGTIPSRESVEIRKVSTDLKMTKVTELKFSVSTKIKDTSSGKVSPYSKDVSLNSFDDYKITQKGTTVHLEFTKDDGDPSGDGIQYTYTRKLSFDIIDFSDDAYNKNPYSPVTSYIKNLKFSETDKASYPQSYTSECRIRELELSAGTMYHSPFDKTFGWYHFVCERSTWGGTNYWTLDSFSHKETYKDWGKSAREYNYSLTDDSESVISITLKYEYTNAK